MPSTKHLAFFPKRNEFFIKTPINLTKKVNNYNFLLNLPKKIPASHSINTKIKILLQNIFHFRKKNV
ncbi:hypothetical protein MASR1M45_13770 [Candidatus Kapaibacterium sp.]